MEKENIDTTKASAQGTEVQMEIGAAVPADGLGKFKSVDALLNAYNSLEAEFTRRSQRLRELEGAATKNGNAGSDDNVSPSLPQSESPSAAREQAPFQKGEEDTGVSQEVRDAIIAEYLASVRKDAPYLMSGGASFVSAPVNRVKTLEDAAAAAAELFRKKS